MEVNALPPGLPLLENVNRAETVQPQNGCFSYAGRSLAEIPVAKKPKFHITERSDTTVQTDKTRPINKRQVKVQTIDKQMRETFPLPAPMDCASNKRHGKSDECRSHFFYCNEFRNTDDPQHPNDFKRVIQAMDQREPEAKSISISAPVKAALLVGESCLLAAAPAIAKQCDLILMVDYDHLLLNLQLARLEFITQCNSLEDEPKFCTNVRGRINPALDKRNQLQLEEDYAKHKDGLKKYHPFSSEQRLSKVKEAVKKLTITPVYCNLFSQTDMTRLGDILKQNNAEITLLNLTNAMEYFHEFHNINKRFYFQDGRPTEYKHVKQCLPITKRSLCVFSALMTRPNHTWICQSDSYWHEMDKVSIAHELELSETESWLDALRHRLDESLSRKWLRLSDPHPRIRTLLAHANQGEIAQLSGSRKVVEDQIRAKDWVSTEKKTEILGWIDDAIRFWEQ